MERGRYQQLNDIRIDDVQPIQKKPPAGAVQVMPPLPGNDSYGSTAHYGATSHYNTNSTYHAASAYNSPPRNISAAPSYNGAAASYHSGPQYVPSSGYGAVGYGAAGHPGSAPSQFANLSTPTSLESPYIGELDGVNADERLLRDSDIEGVCSCLPASHKKALVVALRRHIRATTLAKRLMQRDADSGYNDADPEDHYIELDTAELDREHTNERILFAVNFPSGAYGVFKWALEAVKAIIVPLIIYFFFYLFLSVNVFQAEVAFYIWIIAISTLLMWAICWTADKPPQNFSCVLTNHRAIRIFQPTLMRSCVTASAWYETLPNVDLAQYKSITRRGWNIEMGHTTTFKFVADHETAQQIAELVREQLTPEGVGVPQNAVDIFSKPEFKDLELPEWLNNRVSGEEWAYAVRRNYMKINWFPAITLAAIALAIGVALFFVSIVVFSIFTISWLPIFIVIIFSLLVSARTFIMRHQIPSYFEVIDTRVRQLNLMMQGKGVLFVFRRSQEEVEVNACYNIQSHQPDVDDDDDDDDDDESLATVSISDSSDTTSVRDRPSRARSPMRASISLSTSPLSDSSIESKKEKKERERRAKKERDREKKEKERERRRIEKEEKERLRNEKERMKKAAKSAKTKFVDDL